jgi:uncharacterized membrane protein
MQNALTIHPKVTASTLGGAFALIVAYVLSLFGIQLPAEVAAAIVVIFSFVSGWAAPATAATATTAISAESEPPTS